MKNKKIEGFLWVFILTAAIAAFGYLITTNDAFFQRATPKGVTYREKVKEIENGGEVWKTVQYEIKSVQQDTVYPEKVIRSTLEDWHPKTKTPLVEERVDLNDYLGYHDPETDWNYTDYGEMEEKILKDNGIYYSMEKECWVKKK